MAVTDNPNRSLLKPSEMVATATCRRSTNLAPGNIAVVTVDPSCGDAGGVQRTDATSRHERRATDWSSTAGAIKM